MRTSKFFLATSRQNPKGAQSASHALMLRAGLIRPVTAGAYQWLPLGLRVLQKVEAVVRKAMEQAGAVEILMPALNPAALWQESGRWDSFGEALVKWTDRHGNKFCLAPTHEEVVCDLVRGEVASYRQLPFTLFQIQTKFRDEARPRSGVLRAREFIMKDAYSFDLTEAGLDQSYAAMLAAYRQIFAELDLNFAEAAADTGAIGGTGSVEFQALCEAGEDWVVRSKGGLYVANVELARSTGPKTARPDPKAPLQRLATPGVDSIESLVKNHGVDIEKTVKTMIVKAKNGDLIALVLRGDHRLSEIKAKALPEISDPLAMADEGEAREVIGAGFGSLGPAGLKLRVIADRDAAVLADFSCGANEDGWHLTGVNWGRDAAEPEVADLRRVVDGDSSILGDGELSLQRGIEIGHLFKLGKVYSDAMKVEVQTETGGRQSVFMGCYGLGVSRLVAAVVEQHCDGKGIFWPTSIAPFALQILALGGGQSAAVAALAENLYRHLSKAGVEVLLDDRDERPGVMFADSELIGVPLGLVISERNIKDQQLEIVYRRQRLRVPVPGKDRSVIEDELVALALKLTKNPKAFLENATS